MSDSEGLSLVQWERAARAVLGMYASGLIHLPLHEVVAWQDALEHSAEARGEMATFGALSLDESFV